MSDKKKEGDSWFNQGRDKLSEQIEKAKQVSDNLSKQTLNTLSTQGDQLQKTIQDTTDNINKATKTLIDQSNRLKEIFTQVDTAQFVDNISNYRERFLKNSFDSKPSVLVTGRTGAGKSTLVNKLIGEELALTGAGEPITLEFDYYTSDDLKIDLYDSPGWEGGEQKATQFLQSTQKILSDKKDEIQMVWYVIDAQSTRLVDFEIELLKELLSDKPIAVVLAKCDIATDEQIIGLLRAVIGAKCSTVVGAYELAANPLQKLSKDLEARFSSMHLLDATYYVLDIENVE